MGYSSVSESNCSIISKNSKVIALESTLQQGILKLKDLVADFEQLHIDSENYKIQYLSMKDSCENKTCSSAVELKKIIAAKDLTIQRVASTLTKLNETKNWNIITDVFKLLFDDAAPLTPPMEKKSPECNPCNSSTSNSNIGLNTTDISPIKEVDASITEDVSFKEESLCDDGTSTPGRTSPILHTKKTRSILVKSSGYQDKKKCPDDWPNSDSKALKITPTPTRNKPNKGGKLRQSRLNLVKLKQTAVVDLTCSPEVLAQVSNKLAEPLIKKESMENDDTILPSPTSGPINFTFLKTTSKASPSKFKKPALSLKNSCNHLTKQTESKDSYKEDKDELETSTKILDHFVDRVRYGIKKENETQMNHAGDCSVKKEENTVMKENNTVMKENKTVMKENETPVKMEVFPDEDMTHCETIGSISMLQQIDQHEEDHENNKHSPSKRPLAENINIMNTPPKNDPESSMSILRLTFPKTAVEKVKRKIPELAEPIYKEQAVRKKAEKRNLQGWSCEECMTFYGELYKDDPVMLAKKINECSKHRGKHNPARPKTPPNFWNPRWHVPEDTEELNRMNNAT